MRPVYAPNHMVEFGDEDAAWNQRCICLEKSQFFDDSLYASIMSYKVKTSRGEKAAYVVAVLILLLSLAIAFWKLYPR